MSRLAAALVCALALPLAAPALAGGPVQLPALTRLASKLSGIRAGGRRVHVVYLGAPALEAEATRLLDRDYPPERQEYDQTLYRGLGLLAPDAPLRPLLLATQTRGVPALYDPVGRVLYARRGRRARPAVLHELVHMLQDRAFGLRRLAALRRADRDAAAAASAAVEGDAVLATRAVGGSAPAAAADASPAATFLALEHAFPSATGLQFVATLHNLGGNAAVFGALRRFPQTTRQVFHVDAFLTSEPAATVALPSSAGGLALAGSDTFGELDVRALLATFHVPGLDRAAGGWAGGRSAAYRDGAGRSAVVLDLTWASDLDAERWGEAVALYVNEAFDADAPGLPATVSCASTVCWQVGGRGVAFRRVGSRTALVVAATTEVAAAVASTLDLNLG